MSIDAILWDYDGTLVNSIPKNMAITKQILTTVAPHLSGDNLPEYLKNETNYHIANHRSKNWQDLYINFYGMTENEMLKAGDLWTAHQLKNNTPVRLFSEIKETIQNIKLPQGICSQNSSENINQVLKEYNISHKFSAVIGFDDIPNNMQKPASFSGIECLNRIFGSLKNKTFVYIGDHEGDVKFARNIEKDLEEQGKMISVIATYSGAQVHDWNFKPDFQINTPSEILSIIKDYE